jgi:hypothetical protein
MEDFYETQDLYLTVFLQIKGFNFEIIKNEKGICKFLFEKSVDLDNMKESYFRNDDVPVLSFKNGIRDLKSEIINLK